MQQYNLPKYGQEGYSILKNKCNLYKISNLAPNTRYNLSFNDVRNIFLSDKNGEIYFNNNKQALQMQCISNTIVLLSKADGGTSPDTIGDPIAYYSTNNCNCIQTMFLTIDGKEVEYVISGGAIGPRSPFIPPTNIEYYNENIFSGVGIL